MTVYEAELMPTHFDNGTYFCEEQQDRRERGKVTRVEEDVECQACLRRLARIEQWLSRAASGVDWVGVDWFGDG